MDFSPLTQPESLVSVATLTAMEIVLGIDNIVFISILAARLPPEQQDKARRLGLLVALLSRLGLLFALSWVMGLTAPLFTILGKALSGRDLILLGGGLFLIAKATHEIHGRLEAAEEEAAGRKAALSSMALVLTQIVLLDLVFSLDSVITAVGMVSHVILMVVAMVLSVLVMLFAAGPISRFVNRHPTVKILALSFLLLIGVMLVAEAMGQHVNKGYIYFAMGFSLAVELVNLRMRKRDPVVLHGAAKLPGDTA